ncbi:HlyD family type I secretion periplasmic adaptor subunit [Sneathiella aquimaris]|uniref:HlyD family type I secretion periplasmic adaptor subunit n=1 Tax=Sneathiella aquimaris TaxID=2599305 RepID=UPI00146ED958|nr:HlyD family type I secretion periplasmic adaptor subunit [Sneathiella aquimaris]
MADSLKFISIDQEKYKEEAQPLRKGKPETMRLSQSIMLEETGPSSLLRTAILFCFVILLLFILWAQYALIDEVAVTSGEVIPSGTVQTIQHVDGGTISDITIQEGDIVKEGQVLIRLDPTDALSEIKQLSTQLAISTIKADRLRAFVKNSDFNTSYSDPRFSPLIKEQKTLLESQRLDIQNQRNVLQAQLEQRIGERSNLQDQIKILQTQIAPLREQMKIRQGLLKGKTLSRYDYLESQRQYLKEKGQLDELVLTAKSLDQAIIEARGRLTEMEGRVKKEALDEMALANAEALKTREELDRLQSVIKRLEIRSPVDGVIQGLDVNSIGTVIKAGNPIVSVVPVDQELVLETRVRPEDIGFLQLGQAATVKFTTYNFSRYGSIVGELTYLSATTFQDEEGVNYYKGKVALTQSYVGDDPDRNLILPGMTATADIHSGKKTLLDYLLKPIHTTLAQSFRER